MDFPPLVPLVLAALLAFCNGSRDVIDDHSITFGPQQGSEDGAPHGGYGYLPPSPHDCEHLPTDTEPMKCSDFITKIPRTSAFYHFVYAAHYLLYSDYYYFLLWELYQIPVPEEVPEPDLTSRECKTRSKRLLGYWRDYGELCWIVWAGRQDVRCAECVNEYCCRQFNQTDPISVLPPTSSCRPGGDTIQKFIVFCSYLHGDPYDGYFFIKYTYLPSCCECKTDICNAGPTHHDRSSLR